MLRCAVGVVLCCAVLCCAVLCCAVGWCCAVLRCGGGAVLCCAGSTCTSALFRRSVRLRWSSKRVGRAFFVGAFRLRLLCSLLCGAQFLPPRVARCCCAPWCERHFSCLVRVRVCGICCGHFDLRWSTHVLMQRCGGALCVVCGVVRCGVRCGAVRCGVRC